MTQIDPLTCPLCGKANACLNLGSADAAKECWCNDPNIQFPQVLLAQIPADKRRKACVCKDCAERFAQGKSGVQQFQPL